MASIRKSLFSLPTLIKCGGLLLFLVSCATYQTKVFKARDLIEEGQITEAINHLEPLAAAESDDQLVYLLDYATSLQISGKFQDSNKAYIQADRLSDIKDYTSLSRQTGAFLFGEEMVQYKGEDYEVVLVNAMTAINFLMMNNLESALVEVRRLNEKLNRFRLEAKRKFDKNAFALYLAAMIWEADGKWDDAYISYKDAYEVNPGFERLHADLIRSAKRARRMDEYKKWKTQFPEIKEEDWWYDRNYGELVLIYQQGWGPRKGFRQEDARFPKLNPVYSLTQRVRLDVGGITSYSQELFSVNDTAIATLEDQYSTLVARRFGGVVTKAVVADQFRQKNQALGELAWIVMNVSDRADLRQWSTLPASLHIVRVPLREGSYRYSIQGLDLYNMPSADRIEDVEIQIQRSKKKFINFRSLR